MNLFVTWTISQKGKKEIVKTVSSTREDLLKAIEQAKQNGFMSSNHYRLDGGVDIHMVGRSYGAKTIWKGSAEPIKN